MYDPTTKRLTAGMPALVSTLDPPKIQTRFCLPPLKGVQSPRTGIALLAIAASFGCSGESPRGRTATESVSARSEALASPPAQFLAPDAFGRPQLKITGTGRYYLFRNAGQAGCDSNRYVQVNDTTGKSWCRTLQAFPQNTTVADKVPRVFLAESSPYEFEYMAGASNDVNLASYVGWAPQADPVADPIARWVSTINANYGSNIAASSIPSWSSTVGDYTTLPVTLANGPQTWGLFYNSKYVALFNPKGGLLGLTHRTYGMELINPGSRSADDATAFSIQWPTGLVSASVLAAASISAGTLKQTWTDVSGTSQATVIWNLDEEGLKGQINIVSAGARIERVDFPTIVGLSHGANKEVVWPARNSGLSLPPTTNTEVALERYGEYPSAGWQAQFLSISDANRYTMYVGAHDANWTAKTFHVRPVASGSTNASPKPGVDDLSHYPQNNNVRAVATQYPVVLAPMLGTWEKATKAYQRWALRQYWQTTKQQTPFGLVDAAKVLDPVQQRPISAFVKNGQFWWTVFQSYTDGNGQRQSITPENFRDFIGAYGKDLIGPTPQGGSVGAGFHLYTWWDDYFDTNYPLYPADTAAWTPLIKNAQSDGSVIVPYINGMMVDISDAPDAEVNRPPGCPRDTGAKGFWTHPFALSPTESVPSLKDVLLKGKDGKPYAFNCPPRLLALADPSSATWQRIVNVNTQKVLGMGAKGVYLDVFAAANENRANYATLPNGTVRDGYGDWYLKGVRKIGENVTALAESAEAASRAFGANEPGVRRLVTAEYFSEPTIQYVDMVMNYEYALPSNRPVLQQIYNRHQLMAGQKGYGQSDTAMKGIFARSFVWGYQLGLTAIHHLCPNSNCSSSSSQNLLRYLRTLEKAREAVWMNTGGASGGLGLSWHTSKFVGTADDIGNVVSYEGADEWCGQRDNPSCGASMPTVRGSLWSTKGTEPGMSALTGTDAANALVLTNPTDQPVDAKIPVPRSWASGTITLAYQSGTGATAAPTVAAGTSTLSVTLPANSVAIYAADTRESQSITVMKRAPASWGTSQFFAVAATASSGLPVKITAAGGCTISGGLVTLSSTSDCILTYSQPGDSEYAAAAVVSSTTRATSP